MDHAIRFLLNGEPVEITDLPPMTTLLNWLRYDRRMTGTKEGCAEGDCGACTVGLRSLGPEGIETRPVCACIQTLGMLHGKEVITVEGINAPDGSLHPVQQAMSEGHGSQCGFCTPGFVMSLWCAHKHGHRVDRNATEDALAGNLCRCTGYGPILDAALTAHDHPAPDWEASAETISSRLTDLNTGMLDYQVGGWRFWIPETLDELSALVETQPDATILSGATDIGLWVTKHAFDPENVIYTGRTRELQKIEVTPDAMIIGAGATYKDLMPRLVDVYPSIAALISRIGGAQVRAMGTIGGNIANGSPIGDMPPALIAAGAELILRQGHAEHRMPLEDFFLSYGQQKRRPGDFVQAIRLPIQGETTRLRCYKISKRHDQDITSVLGCFNVTTSDGIVTDARIAFGGMAGIPARAKATEAALIGQLWAEDAVASAAVALDQDFTPMTDHRGSSNYRMETARALLIKYWLETTSDTVAHLNALPSEMVP